MKIKLVIVLCLFSFSVVAQKYGTAIGPRIGESRFGISVKQRILPSFTAEAMTELQSDAYQFTILPKYHLPITGEGLNIFFGAGAHIGGLKEFGATYGYDLMGGIEWKIPALPLVIGADVKPAYHINHEDWFEFPATVSVHYVFSKETKAKRKKQRAKRKKRKERRERREERREKRQEWWNDFRNI
ncbi:hypothetical protein [Marivirga harenae]|uniref:hypothetical protein n=1 Tax=Marivirga harenae TaxID=2010992 RepID=UPI0026E06979|nr:hypothetical protein [Marivirga harenae]WKV10946.1 hypothetical protein Q3Y49_12055 [Marivirga harenae]|tara:strand:+ start:3858 stop:4415 length:558 start_codon:yes stop_codon:yes gene_type:complete